MDCLILPPSSGVTRVGRVLVGILGGLLDDVVFLLDKAGAAFKFDKAHAGRPHTHPHGLRLDVWNSVLRC